MARALATATSRWHGDPHVQRSMPTVLGDEKVRILVVSCALQHMAKIGPVGAHPLFEGALLERRRAQFWTCKTYYTSIVRAKVFNK